MILPTSRKSSSSKPRIVIAGEPSLIPDVTKGDRSSKVLAPLRAEGAKGVAREGGSGRRAAIAKMTEGLGGKLETFYYAFGDVDAYVIVDVPDSISAAAIALAVNQAGSASVKTVVLIPPEDMDKAGKKAVDYRPPGR